MKRLGIYLGRHRGHGGGIGQYASSLVSGLANLKEELPETEVYVYADQNFLKSSKIEIDPGFKYKKLPNIFGGRLDWLLDQLVLPVRASLDKMDLLHSVSNQGFLLWRGRQLVTVHDLFQAYPPGEKPSLVNKCYQYFFKLQFLSRSSQFITDIKEVKELLVSKYSLAKERVSCVELGLDEEFLNYQAKQVELKPGYAFVIAGFGARKNLANTLDAWLKLDEEYRQKGLVVVLSDSRAEPVVQSKLGKCPNVSIVTKASREQMIDYYSSAGVVLNPTLAEGFGLPVLEGLAKGANVVTGPIDWASNLEGVFVCDPKDVENISASLRKAFQVSRQPSENFRTYLDVAKETLAVYKMQ